MTRILTNEAKKTVMGDASLYADICMILKVKAGSLSQIMYRNSASLLNHDVVKLISEAMGKRIEDILEVAPQEVSNKTKLKKPLLNSSL